MNAGDLDRLVVIQKPVADDSFNGAGSGTWVPLEEDPEVWANIRDNLPSRSEKLGEGISMSSRPSRLRIRYREDINASMRFVYGARVMQIISGPAEIGRREYCEFMVEDYSPSGNPA